MFPDESIRAHFQEVAGLVLTPHRVLRGQVILIGPPKCGKTTLATAIGCAPAGPRGMGNTQEYALVKDKWSRTDLLGKFINVSDDSPTVAGWPGFAKHYTSGKFRIEFKYQTPVTVLGTAKLWSTCNEMPDTSDASGAMSDRLVPFIVEGRVREDAEDPTMMSDHYWNDLDRRRAVTEWMIQGLLRYWGRGGKFAPPQAWVDSKTDAVGMGDPLEGWFRANLIRDPEGKIEKAELEQKIPMAILPRIRADQTIPMYLLRLFGSESVRVRDGDSKKRVYTGIAWS